MYIVVETVFAIGQLALSVEIYANDVCGITILVEGFSFVIGEAA